MQRHGGWIYVCGPSGAGKDSVMAWARERLGARNGVSFARRLVTRAAAPGSTDDSIAAAEFERLLASGGLAMHWRAHGTAYGIARAYRGQVDRGDWVVVNGSREHVASMEREELGRTRIVFVTAPAEVIARRLQQRGREAGTAIDERIERGTALPPPRADCMIVNDSALEKAGARFVEFVERCAALR
ncbi:MAG TPA: phosphonate metabolism protein/1,5-bisphosphokinase (PRPP-forming) PhnN [Burkholderiaceae bacterium]